MTVAQRAANRRRGRSKIVPLFFLGLTVTACGASLPEDFETLTTHKQVEALEEFYSNGGISSLEAESIISSRGFPAAEAMTAYLEGNETGVPIEMAVTIVWDVQLRGCSLRGTSAEAALRILDSRPLEQHLRFAVEAALEAIEKDLHAADGLDRYGAGACASADRPGE